MFLAVVDHGGFNQAAAVVHKSQSTVHHAVQKLEQSLGVALFEVRGRKTALTPHGELLVHRGRYLLAEADRVESVAASLSVGVEASLCIAVDEAFPHSLLFSVIETVSQRFPSLKVELIEAVLSGSNELVETGSANVGLSAIPMEGGLNEEICRIRFLAVANPEHPLHQLGRELSEEDIKAHRQIVVRDSALSRSTDQGWLGSEQRWTVSHMRSSMELVLKGLGFAWLPEPAIAAQLQSGQLRLLDLPRGLERSMGFYLNYRDIDLLGPAAREFMGEMRLQSMAHAESKIIDILE